MVQAWDVRTVKGIVITDVTDKAKQRDFNVLVEAYTRCSSAQNVSVGEPARLHAGRSSEAHPLCVISIAESSTRNTDLAVNNRDCFSDWGVRKRRGVFEGVGQTCRVRTARDSHSQVAERASCYQTGYTSVRSPLGRLALRIADSNSG